MKKVIPIVLILSMGLFSLLAITIGFKLAFENGEVSKVAYQKLGDLANQGNELHGVTEKNQIPSNYLFNIYHTLSSSAKYAYGEGSYLEAYDAHSHRAGMEKFSLYVHIILGGIILFTGSFQFWVWFRRRYKKIHRIFGILYITSCIGLGFFVFFYLLLAGITTTHEEYIGYLGLHLLNCTTIIPVFISVYYLYKKDFVKHLGWMSLSFGSILTAPTQRISWGILAYSDLGETHAVLNSIVDTCLFALCYIIGYLLFCFNRSPFPLKQYKPVSMNLYVKVIAYIFSVLAIITLLYHYCFTEGMADSEFSKLVIQQDIITKENSVVYAQKMIPVLYSFFNIVGLIIGAYLLTTTKCKKEILRTYIASALVIALIEFYWGYTLGLPSTLHGVGGSHYVFWGIIHLFFAVLIIFAMKTAKANSFLREWVIYLWILLFAAVARYWFIYIHALCIEMINPIYIEENHVHQFIVTLPMAILVIIALITSVYGTNSTRRSIY